MSENELYITWVLLGIVIWGLFHVSKQIDHIRKEVEALRNPPPPRHPIEYEY
jgi:hypothetical protein